MDEEIAEFVKCVGAITLKGYPGEFLTECLLTSNIEVTVGLVKSRGALRKYVPWLSIGELCDRPWTSKIRSAHLLSDGLSDPYDLHILQSVQNLTIYISSIPYSSEDLYEFAKVLNELKSLKLLVFIVKSDEEEQAKEGFSGLFNRLDFRIEVEGVRHPRKKKVIPPRTLSNESERGNKASEDDWA